MQHLERVNATLTDQVRLLKNRLSRQRQDYEHQLVEIRKECTSNYSSKTTQERVHLLSKNIDSPTSGENGQIISEDIANVDDETENETPNTRKLSDLEVCKIKKTNYQEYIYFH